MLIIIRILSGHNNLNYHLNKIDLVPDDKCEYCTEVMKHTDHQWEINCMETAFHILCKCQYFSIIRANIYHKFVIKKSDLFKRKDSYYSLYKLTQFIKQTKILRREPKYDLKNLSPRRLFKRKRDQNDDESPKPKKVKRTLKFTPSNKGTLLSYLK
jgi:hypothetical protein